VPQQSRFEEWRRGLGTPLRVVPPIKLLPLFGGEWLGELTSS
jgi:hypothetical protein